MSTIITKNSSTASAVPLAADLVQGELAVNVTDKRLFTQNASDVVVELGTNPSSVTTASATITGGTVNGTSVGASTPSTGAFTTLSASGNVTLGDASTDTLNVGNGGLIKDAAGNLGLGVTPSASWFTGSKVFQFGTVGALWSNGSNNTAISHNAVFANASTTYLTTAEASYYRQFTGQHQWFTAPSGTAGNAISFTQAMTLDASGNLLVGTTTIAAGRLNIAGYADGGQFGVVMQTSGATASPFSFRNSAGTQVGSIATTNTATSYVTSSDYRLKENVQPMIGALEKVAALKPCTYTWKATGESTQGFIAHELAEIVPDCVIGEKDAVDEEGNPKYQGIDTSFLVATLTAAIQEQQALITTLTERITALEAK